MRAEFKDGFEQDCACPKPLDAKVVMENDCACPIPSADTSTVIGGKLVTEKRIGGVMIKVSVS